MAINFDLNDLLAFRAVAELSNFRKAAESVHLSQPAFSRRIDKLEQALGVRLLERSTRRVSLTTVGRDFERKVRELLDELDTTLLSIRGVAATRMGEVTVACVPSTVHYYLTEVLRRYHARHPKVRVSFKVTNRKGLLQNLEDNEADLLLMGQPPDNQDLVAESFLINPLVIIAPQHHPLSGRRSIPLKELANETFIMREIGSGTRNSVERFLAERGVHLTVSMEMNTNSAIKQGVEEGLGLGIVSIHTLERELEGGRLTVLNVESFPIIRQWYLVHRAGKRLSAIATEFAQFVRNESHHFVRKDQVEMAVGHALTDLRPDQPDP